MLVRRFTLCLCAAVFSVSPALAEFQVGPQTYRPQFYDLQDLGTLSGDETNGVGINNLGEVVGSGDVLPYGWLHGFFCDQSLSDAGAPSNYLQSHLDALNDAGQAIGWANSDIYDADSEAYLWENHTWTPLGTLPGLDSSRPTDINNVGQIVGWSYGGGYSRAWIWEAGVMTPLETPQYTSTAHAINESGTIIAGAVNADGVLGRLHATVWTEDGIVQLGTLTGSRSSSVANDVNDGGFVVGSKYSVVYGFKTGTAFFWDGDAMTLLPKPDGWYSAFGNAINESNQVVGDLYGPASTRDAFIWENGVTRSLTELLDPNGGWLMISANDINDAGQIVGTATLNSGDPHAVVLTPVERPVAFQRDQILRASRIDPNIRR